MQAPGGCDSSASQATASALIGRSGRSPGRGTDAFLRWARLVSNQRPLACEASALPLSYAPGVVILGPDVAGATSSGSIVDADPQRCLSCEGRWFAVP